MTRTVRAIAARAIMMCSARSGHRPVTGAGVARVPMRALSGRSAGRGGSPACRSRPSEVDPLHLGLRVPGPRSGARGYRLVDSPEVARVQPNAQRPHVLLEPV